MKALAIFAGMAAFGRVGGVPLLGQDMPVHSGGTGSAHGVPGGLARVGEEPILRRGRHATLKPQVLDRPARER